MAPEINDATERALVADSRKVKFRDSEVDDKAMKGLERNRHHGT